MEGRKKVPPSSSHTTENVSASCVSTTRTRSVGASRQQHHRGEETRRDNSSVANSSGCRDLVVPDVEDETTGFILGSGDPLTREHSWADQGLLSRASVSPRGRTMDHFPVLTSDSLPIGLLEDVAQPSTATLTGFTHFCLGSVDTRSGQVDTSPRFQKTQLPDWDSRSTLDQSRSTLDPVSSRPVLQKWDSRSTLVQGRSTHSGNSVT
ncbi:hypothetical protein Taro_001835 [Colocasia esculenta]|uniref:Uncharacterized protein n=1 Tax=Colocasia esculenta TaxID=4460 RepID=A0A843TJ40_COLES|nr:hypothetical protein [Colocasia esculenta]